jgi:hypothetical protein
MDRSESIDMDLYGHSISISLVEPRNSKRVVDIEHEDGRRWRLVVTSQGSIDQVETTWRDGELADLDRPDWLEDALARLARAA